MTLEAWGWTDVWAAAWARIARPDDAGPGRVVRDHRSRFVVAGADAVVPATLAPGAARPTTGDWVVMRPGGPRDTWLILDVLPRRTEFARGAPGDAGHAQVVAANVDTVWIVHGLDTPLNVRRLERYLALAWESGARPVIVLTKRDLAPDPDEAGQALAGVAIGVPVRTVSVLDAGSLAGLEEDLRPGETIALLGPSGAGKSSLVNALVGTALLEVGEVRGRDRKGRHTTTRRELVPIAGGALLLDTPGMREIQLVEADAGLEQTFSDIASLAEQCRFNDCAHDTEPGCAVQLAVAEGRLDPARLEHFRALRAEAAWQRRKTDARARQEEAARWKSIHKSMRAHLKRRYD